MPRPKKLSEKEQRELKQRQAVLKKIEAGQTLTVRDQACLQRTEELATGKKTYAKNIDELCEILGYSRNKVVRLTKLEGYPKRNKHGYLLDRVMDFVKKEAKAKDEAATVREQKTLKEIEMLELKIDVLRGKYIAAEAVDEIQARHASKVRTLVYSACDISSELEGHPVHAIRERIEKWCDSVCLQLKQHFESQ